MSRNQLLCSLSHFTMELYLLVKEQFNFTQTQKEQGAQLVQLSYILLHTGTVG
jgi:hypothetical protein